MMVRIPIEDAVELLEMEGYQIDSFPEGVIIEVPETFTPDDLYEIITEVLAMDEEQSSTVPIQIDRFDKGGIDITMEMRHIAPFLTLTDGVYFGIKNGKMDIAGIDPARIMMLGVEESIELPPNIIPDKDVEYHIGIEDGYKTAKKLLHSNTPIRIVGNFEEWSNNKNGQPIYVYVGDKQYGGWAEYGRKPKLPQINLPAYIEVNPKDMANTLYGISKFSVSVKLIARGDDLEVIGKSESPDEMKVKFKGVVKKNADGTVASTYPLDYIYKMVNTVKKSKHPLEIHLGTDYPTDIRFTHEEVRYIYLLASRAEAY